MGLPEALFTSENYSDVILAMPITERTRAEHPIRVLLFARRIPRRQLAEAIGYGERYVENVVNGRMAVTGEFARRCSQHLGMPVEELFAGLKEDR